MKDIEELLNTTIMESTSKKMLEAAGMNPRSLRHTLEHTSQDILTSLKNANKEILEMKIEKLEVKASKEDTTGTSSDENGDNTQSETVSEPAPAVTGTLGFPDTTNTQQQVPGSGLFVRNRRTSPWNGPLQMGVMNSLGSNAQAMYTPTPMCVVYGNAHDWPGAQAPCFDAACGPWPSALSNAQAADCAQSREYYVLAR